MASQPVPPKVHALRLGHGVELRCWVPSLDDRIGIAVAHRDHVLFSKVFHRDDGVADFRVDWKFVRASGKLAVDVFEGTG